jgi:small subunit ribosomal protein S30e
MPTHGSLTKAGKVRAQTPQIVGIKKQSPSPKKRNRNNYLKRVVNTYDDRRNGRRRR